MSRRHCAHCGRLFETQRARRYCTQRCNRRAATQQRRTAAKDRLRLLEAAHAGIELPAQRIDLNDVDPCHYCGLPAETVDHVIPQASLGDLEALHIRQIGSQRTWTVQACRECNSALQNRLFRSLPERKRWIKDWLRHRYQKYLKTPQWTPDELHELDYSLRQNVLDHIEAKKTLIMRLRW